MGVHPVHAAVTTPYVQKLIAVRARQVVRQPGFRRSDQADVEQELVVHILKEAHLFDPARSCARTFIAQVVDSAGAMILRDRRRKKQAAGHRLQSLEGTTLLNEGEEKTLLDVLVDEDLHRRHGSHVAGDEERSDVSADTAAVLSRLAPDPREIAHLLMAGAREATIARALGISRRQVRSAVAAIRRHLKDAGLAEI
jgi:RNA polymerase sigma factor (sigma-70 family)